MSETTVLLVDYHHGVFVPKVFVERVWHHLEAWGIDRIDAEVLMHPDDDRYWDVWQHVLDTAETKDSQGVVWHLWQDGALWTYSDNGEQFV